MHELGHLLAGLMPAMFMFLAGSVLQVAVPLGLAAYFLFRRKEWASAGFCLAWAGTSARDVAVYVADAPVQALPLIGGGTHDWAYLLGPQGFDSIGRAAGIARFIEVLGLLMVIGGVVVCLWRPAAGWLASRRAPVAPGSRRPSARGRRRRPVGRPLAGGGGAPLRRRGGAPGSGGRHPSRPRRESVEPEQG